MSDLTRSEALKRLVGMGCMPRAFPRESKAVEMSGDVFFEDALLEVYENVLWAMAPMLYSAVPGEIMHVAPFLETKRRLGVLAEALEVSDG